MLKIEIWLNEFTWLAYNNIYNGAFCKWCVVFAPQTQGRRQRGAVVPGPPISRFTPRLLHTSNSVFKKCGPPFWFLAPLLLNPGDGPAQTVSCNAKPPGSLVSGPHCNYKKAKEHYDNHQNCHYQCFFKPFLDVKMTPYNFATTP